MLLRDMFDNVIVGVDGHEAGRDALALATRLISPRGQLTLAHVQVVKLKPAPDSGTYSLAVDRLPAWQRLRSLRDESERAAHVLCVEAGSVVTGLHELAARHGADLLVIGATRRDDYERVFLGNDTRTLLEHAPCPVAVAPAGYATRAPRLQRIGAAYDGSPESEQALALARLLAHELAGELAAFEAVPEPVDVQDAWDPQPEIDAGVAEARGRIAALGDVEAHAASSEDDEHVPEVLSRYGASVDLLVIGSHTYRPIDHLVSGSTAQRLADGAPCPILVLSRSTQSRSTQSV
jgi:nucleotide-binding universal stress UspA family protein